MLPDSRLLGLPPIHENEKSTLSPHGGAFTRKTKLYNKMITKTSVGLNEAPGLTLPFQIMPPKDATGHQRLWAAVLDNALLGLEERGAFKSGKNTHERKRRLHDEALAWLQSTLTAPGSFIFICEHRGLDADCVRERLLAKYTFQVNTRRRVRHASAAAKEAHST